MYKIKFYYKGLLFKSIPLQSISKVFDCIQEAQQIAEGKIFIEKRPYSFSVQKIVGKNVQVYYLRSDGEKCFTLPIHPKYYPITAFYSDGRKELIELNKK